MERRDLVRAYRLAITALVFFAIIYQAVDRWDNPTFSLSNFLSFFTIESNVVAATVLLYGALWRYDAPPSARWDVMHGAAVLYMATTGVVYGVLLAGYQDALQTSLPWVNTVLHRVMPIVMVIDWLVDPPQQPVPYRRALLWLLAPIAFLVYSMIRGPIVDWYPYPFLDPDRVGGYGGVAVYCLAIAVGVAAFAWVVTRVHAGWFTWSHHGHRPAQHEASGTHTSP